MNNQETNKTLEVAKAKCEWNAPLDYQGAFDVAIYALEKQIPKETYIPNVENCEDCLHYQGKFICNREGICKDCEQV